MAAAAAKHNRFDRLNDALDQVAATKKTVSGFLSETEEKRGAARPSPKIVSRETKNTGGS